MNASNIYVHMALLFSVSVMNSSDPWDDGEKECMVCVPVSATTHVKLKDPLAV